MFYAAPAFSRLAPEEASAMAPFAGGNCQTAQLLMDTATSAMVSYGIVVDFQGFVNVFLQFYSLFYCWESEFLATVGCILAFLCYNGPIPFERRKEKSEKTTVII